VIRLSAFALFLSCGVYWTDRTGQGSSAYPPAGLESGWNRSLRPTIQRISAWNCCQACGRVSSYPLWPLCPGG